MLYPLIREDLLVFGVAPPKICYDKGFTLPKLCTFYLYGGYIYIYIYIYMQTLLKII